MILIPMKDARERSLAKFYDICFGTYRIQSQGLRCFVDTKHRNPFCCGKTEFRRESKEYSLPKYLQIIYKQVMPHSILSC